MLKAMKAHENTVILNDTINESIICPESVKILPDSMDSKISIEDTQSLEPPNNKGMYENILHCENDDTLVIDNKGVDINRIQEHKPEGRRIVDISFFLAEMHRTFDNHARGIECPFKDWILINSRRKGFLTEFFFKCRMCNYEASFWSESRESKKLDINSAVVVTTTTAGIGYSTL